MLSDRYPPQPSKKTEACIKVSYSVSKFSLKFYKFSLKLLKYGKSLKSDLKDILVSENIGGKIIGV